MKKIGLALGAGGARGFCHIGVLDILEKNNVPIHVVTGCSMGALVAGGMAAGLDAEQMLEIAKSIGNTTVFDLDLFGMKKGGLAKGNRAMNLYRKHVGERLIEDCKIKIAVIATNLATKTLHTFKSGLLWRAVRASMSIPGVFHPVRDGDDVFVDGGVMKRMPISEARELGANFVIAVDALGAPPEDAEPDSMLKILELSYQVLDWRSAQFEGRGADVLIVPDMGRKSSFKFKNNEEAVQAGRDAAVKALPQIYKLLKMKLPKGEKFITE